MIKIPLTRKQMIKAIVDTLKANKIKDGYIRVIVTRGEGDLGLDPKKCFGKPGVIIIADKMFLNKDKDSSAKIYETLYESATKMARDSSSPNPSSIRAAAITGMILCDPNKNASSSSE